MLKLRHQKIFSTIIYYTLSLLSGIFMGTTVAPIGAWFLAWVSLTPLWMLLIKITPKTDKNYPSAPV
ncbi:MAG: apolipoprotein N-acyltransferase, partial [Dolichospermum sp.]